MKFSTDFPRGGATKNRSAELKLSKAKNVYTTRQTKIGAKKAEKRLFKIMYRQKRDLEVAESPSSE